MSLKLNSVGGGSVTLQEPNTASNFTLDLPAASGTLLVPGQASAVVSGTAVASTSGTSIDFTGIPSWVKKITVMFSGVSLNGAGLVQVQLGDSGGIENTGYTSGESGTGGVSTTGFAIVQVTITADTMSGLTLISLLNSNTWVYGSDVYGTAYGVSSASGVKTLSATLDRIRITTVAGTATFDAGTINILYE
jgi:hypothetical protein